MGKIFGFIFYSFIALGAMFGIFLLYHVASAVLKVAFTADFALFLIVIFGLIALVFLAFFFVVSFLDYIKVKNPNLHSLLGEIWTLCIAVIITLALVFGFIGSCARDDDSCSANEARFGAC